MKRCRVGRLRILVNYCIYITVTLTSDWLGDIYLTPCLRKSVLDRLLVRITKYVNHLLGILTIRNSISNLMTEVTQFQMFADKSGTVCTMCNLFL